MAATAGEMIHTTVLHDETTYTCAAHDPKDVRYAEMAEKIVKQQIVDRKEFVERYVGKHAALGMGYGPGASRVSDFIQSVSRIDRSPSKRANAHAEFEHNSEASMLPIEERRWAAAFHAVYKVDTHFYIKATPKVKREREEWALKTSELDTAIGRKAAEVVVHRTMSALEGEKLEPAVDWSIGEFKRGGTVTGRMRSNADDQIDAYRYLYSQNFPKQITGMKADTIILDEVSKMKSKHKG